MKEFVLHNILKFQIISKTIVLVKDFFLNKSQKSSIFANIQTLNDKKKILTGFLKFFSHK